MCVRDASGRQAGLCSITALYDVTRRVSEATVPAISIPNLSENNRQRHVCLVFKARVFYSFSRRAICAFSDGVLRAFLLAAGSLAIQVVRSLTNA